MFVIAIFGIVLSVVRISTYNILENKLKSYALELTWDIRGVRYRSIAEGNTDAHIRCNEYGYMVIDNSMLIKKVEFENSYKIIGGGMSGEISFTENGVPIHPQTIKIKNTRTGKEKRITIVVNTGRILLYEE